MRRALSLSSGLLCLALLFGLWNLFITVRSPAEWAIGVGCCLLGTLLFATVRRGRATHFRPRARWLASFGRLPLSLIADTARVFATLPGLAGLGDPPAGRMRAIEFDGGAPVDPRSQARRAIALWLVSATPNSVALGVDVDGDVLLLHELVPSSSPPPGTDLRSP